MSEAAAAPSSRLRTVLCTCGGLYGALVLRRLRACDSLDVCAIIRSSRVIDARFGFLRGAAVQISLSGAAYALYLWCVTTLADWLCIIGGVGAVPTRTRPAGIAVLTTRDVNDARSAEFLSACAPDLLVSAFFNQRVHAPALALPKYGCLNIHPSLLPGAKGVDPVFQCLLRGASSVGVSVHFMESAMDAGRIVAQGSFDMPSRSSVFAITAMLFDEGAALLTDAISSIVCGSIGAPQKDGGDYQSWPTRQEMRNLRKRGGALLQWADLARMIRGRNFI